MKVNNQLDKCISEYEDKVGILKEHAIIKMGHQYDDMLKASYVCTCGYWTQSHYCWLYHLRTGKSIKQDNGPHGFINFLTGERFDWSQNEKDNKEREDGVEN